MSIYFYELFNELTLKKSEFKANILDFSKIINFDYFYITTSLKDQKKLVSDLKKHESTMSIQKYQIYDYLKNKQIPLWQFDSSILKSISNLFDIFRNNSHFFSVGSIDKVSYYVRQWSLKIKNFTWQLDISHEDFVESLIRISKEYFVDDFADSYLNFEYLGDFCKFIIKKISALLLFPSLNHSINQIQKLTFLKSILQIIDTQVANINFKIDFSNFYSDINEELILKLKKYNLLEENVLVFNDKSFFSKVQQFFANVKIANDSDDKYIREWLDIIYEFFYKVYFELNREFIVLKHSNYLIDGTLKSYDANLLRPHEALVDTFKSLYSLINEYVYCFEMKVYYSEHFFATIELLKNIFLNGATDGYEIMKSIYMLKNNDKFED